jgi:hypothetical protein
MIDILVPVLSRPQNVRPLIDSIKQNTKVPYRVVFIVSPDDGEEIEAIYMARAAYMRCVRPEYAPKINQAVSLSKAEFVFLGADDLRFLPDWDMHALAMFEDTQKPVIGTNDLGNRTVMEGLHATHSLVHRSYVEQGTIDEPGKLLHEGYVHNWVDTEFVQTAMKRNAFVFARESHVEHLHPFWGKSESDPIYERGQKDYHRDAKLFRARKGLWR